MQIKYIATNPGSCFIEDDLQALLYSARQEPQNLLQYSGWCKYLKDTNGTCFQCNKIYSDSPNLLAAVSLEQTMVIQNQIRKVSAELKLDIPNVIDYVVISYYKQKAIYPQPRSYKFMPPYPGREPPYGPFSWKIDEGESMKDWNHPFNIEDRVREKQARLGYARHKSHGQEQQLEIQKKGHWQQPGRRHQWHC